MTTVPTLPASDEMPRTCPSWCATHDTDFGVCNGTTAVIAGDQTPGRAHEFYTSLTSHPAEGTSLLVAIDREAHLINLDDAEQLAYAILGRVAVGRASQTASASKENAR